MMYARPITLCALTAAATAGGMGPVAAQEASPAQEARYAALLAHLDPLGDPAATRYVGVVSSMVNVFPGEPPPPEQVCLGPCGMGVFRVVLRGGGSNRPYERPLILKSSLWGSQRREEPETPGFWFCGPSRSQ